MSPSHPTEQRFERHIEECLAGSGYSKVHYDKYDRQLCLIPEEVVAFLKNSQPNEWKKLEQQYGANTETSVLKRISDEIARRGVIDVLRGQVKDRGVYLRLCYFKPKSGLNPDHIELYQKNRLNVLRQLHYSTQNQNSIDMGLFVNGIPVITMELKNQLTGQNILNSEKQYRQDRDPREPLLKFKRCVAHFCVDNDRVSMATKLNNQGTFFLPYNKGIENPPVEDGYRSEYLWKDILVPESLMDILENFVHVSKEKSFEWNSSSNKVDTKEKEVLIFPRYHQLDLIRKLKAKVTEDGTGHNYLVQHTTGSGKSYSIGWLSHTLTSLFKSKKDTNRLFDSVIVVTDRTVLDDQLRNTISSLAKTEGVVTGIEQGSGELRQALEDGKSIIITTIQKFPHITESITSLKDKTFAVVIDEVHSSQSGEFSKSLKQTLSGEEQEEDETIEEIIQKEIESRGKQDHISFFGFTGTPKNKTLQIFGTKNSEGNRVAFHSYEMRQSIAEGFTLDVLQHYTTYKRLFRLNEIASDKDKEVKKGKRQIMRYVDSDPKTIEAKVQVMLDHWINFGSREIQGQARAMIVVQSRKHCVQYFEEVNRQLEPHGHKALVAFSGTVKMDGEEYTESGLNKTIGHEGNIPIGLKNPRYKILIVSNKFQTGFDEPMLQSMYVDKALNGVQCVQTLSRLNRTTRGKDRTFVLDFVNDPQVIQEAFQEFYQKTILEGDIDPNKLYDKLTEIEAHSLYRDQEIEEFSNIFFQRGRETDQMLHPILDKAVDIFKAIESEEIKETIKADIQSFIRMYGFLSQVMEFSDVELEKKQVYLKFLNKKLPKKKSSYEDISDLLELEFLKIKYQGEQELSLSEGDTTIEPPGFDSGPGLEEEPELISEIIKGVNKKFGEMLSEEDRVILNQINNRIQNSELLDRYQQGDNSPANKKDYFNKHFDGEILETVNNNVDFYQKLEENPDLRKFLQEFFFRSYNKKKAV
jgi:type I restriction enzyme R subunit